MVVWIRNAVAAGALALAAAGPAAAEVRVSAPECRVEQRALQCGVTQTVSFERWERVAPIRTKLGLMAAGAIVNQKGDRLASAIAQSGSSNLAFIRQVGKDHNGVITQAGTDNAAGLIQIGAGQNGRIDQAGVGQRTLVIQSGVRIR